MGQSGAIRSRQQVASLLAEILDPGPSELFPPRAVVPLPLANQALTPLIRNAPARGF